MQQRRVGKRDEEEVAAVRTAQRERSAWQELDAEEMVAPHHRARRGGVVSRSGLAEELEVTASEGVDQWLLNRRLGVGGDSLGFTDCGLTGLR